MNIGDSDIWYVFGWGKKKNVFLGSIQMTEECETKDIIQYGIRQGLICRDEANDRKINDKIEAYAYRISDEGVRHFKVRGKVAN